MRAFRWARAWRIHRLLGGRPGRVLDVGCGRGFTLAKLQDWGHEVYGIQISPEAAEFARARLGLAHIQTRDLLDVGYPPAMFDLVTLYHVLEHLVDPVATLREIHRILRPGGRLVVEVPHAGGLGARFTGRHWLGWDLPYHRFHFTRESLHLAMTSSGLTPQSWHFPTVEYGPVLVGQGMLSALLGGDSRLFRTLTHSGRSSDRLGSLGLTFHLLSTLLLGLPALGVALAGWAFRKGEVIAVVARKG